MNTLADKMGKEHKPVLGKEKVKVTSEHANNIWPY